MQARSMSLSSSAGCSGSLVLLFLIAAALGRFQHWAVCALQDGSPNPSPVHINQTRCGPRTTPPMLQDPSKVARFLSGPPCFVVEASGRRRESHTAWVALSINYCEPVCMLASPFTRLLFDLLALPVACMLE